MSTYPATRPWCPPAGRGPGPQPVPLPWRYDGLEVFEHLDSYYAVPEAEPGADFVARARRLCLAGRTLDELRTAVRRYTAVEETLAAAAAALAAGEDPRPLLRGAELEDLRRELVRAYLHCPFSIGVVRALALVALALGRDEEALFHLRKAAELDPAGGRAVASFAAAHRILGRAAQAPRAVERLERGLRRLAIARSLTGGQHHVLFRRPEVLELTRGVIQVGANIGDDVEFFCRAGIRHQCYFEPVPEAYAELERRLAQLDRGRFDVCAFRLALADRAGELDFWLGRETGNSSFYDLSPRRSQHHRHNVHARRIKVPTETLDRLAAAGRIDLSRYNMLFMDVQGAEHDVLRGARRSLAAFDFVILEVSYAEIYEGNPLAEESRAFLHELGFRLYAEEPGCYAEQGDAIYVRIGSEAERILFEPASSA